VTVRIAHLSDIHFGAENRPAVEAAIAAVATFAPTLTMVTGDLTLNGLPQEFLSARRWLDHLPAARIVTPGNHDTPYWNLILRALTPFNRYRRYIGDPNEAAFDAPGLAARTLNSARGGQPRFDWSKGSLAIDELEAIDWRAPEGAALRVFGCHHPLIDLPSAPVTGGVHRGEQAAVLLAASGVELVLTGHVHVPFALPLQEAGHVAYAIGAGTLSLRTRGAPASFSTIDVEKDVFEVRVHAWDGARFAPDRAWSLPRGRRASERLAKVEIQEDSTVAPTVVR
jgi:3',5'-cyclic AMP phosphodiesterase CpdA